MRHLFLLILFLFGSSCGSGSRGVLKVGIDPDWYPLDFGAQTSYVNGFVDDLLLEMARYGGMEFEKVTANWDNLFDGLNDKRYDAVFSSMPPYEYNTAKYDFSSNFLNLGPVLILPVSDLRKNLANLKGALIGIVAEDPAVLILEKYPDIIIRNYPSIPDLLNAVVKGDIQGALLDRIPAVNYVSDLYAGKLKIVGSPLTEKGLHLVARKGNRLVSYFNKNLNALRKKGVLKNLLKKWGLGPS